MNIENILAQMTDEELVGQVCVPILQSGDITEDIKKCIQDYNVGMVRFCPNAEFDGHSQIIGAPNKYRDAAEMAEFINELQDLAKIPMFIAVDQEGSIRNDINRAGAFAYSGHMSFGAANDPELTYEIAKATAKEFASMGINLVQAPIVDVITYDGRKTMKSASFGESVERVCEHSLAMMKGFHDGGVVAMAKHFPGYGSVATDAHKGLAEIVKDFSALQNEDIAPLKLLIENGLGAIMTGHALTHCVDNEFPATMSKKMITGYLRNTLGFDGIVETDALRMPAIQALYSTQKAAVMAINAGCDMLLLRGNMQHFKDGYDAVLDAVKNGGISRQQIEASVRRILKQKERIGLWDKKICNPKKADEIVGCRAHKQLAETLAEKSVSVFKNSNLPLRRDSKICVVCVEPQKIFAAQDEEQSVDMLYKAVKEEFADSHRVLTKLQPENEQIELAYKTALESDVIIVGTCNAILYDKQQELVSRLIKTGVPLVVVAMDSPYDYEVMPDFESYICTYGVAAASMRAAVKFMTGRAAEGAAAPITIKELV